MLTAQRALCWAAKGMLRQLFGCCSGFDVHHSCMLCVLLAPSFAKCAHLRLRHAAPGPPSLWPSHSRKCGYMVGRHSCLHRSWVVHHRLRDCLLQHLKGASHHSQAPQQQREPDGLGTGACGLGAAVLVPAGPASRVAGSPVVWLAALWLAHTLGGGGKGVRQRNK